MREYATKWELIKLLRNQVAQSVVEAGTVDALSTVSEFLTYTVSRERVASALQRIQDYTTDFSPCLWSLPILESKHTIFNIIFCFLSEDDAHQSVEYGNHPSPISDAW